LQVNVKYYIVFAVIPLSFADQYQECIVSIDTSLPIENDITAKIMLGMVIAVSTLALMLATALTVVMLKKNKKHKC
jgi:hypothetical protein